MPRYAHLFARLARYRDPTVTDDDPAVRAATAPLPKQELKRACEATLTVFSGAMGPAVGAISAPPTKLP
jgi:hypothetical protein